MACEIIYTCNSLNNKNVRRGELNILEKYEEQLYFVFGENEMNTKKRFYNDLETLNKDFEALMKLKNSESEQVGEQVSEQVEEIKEVSLEEANEIISDAKKKAMKKKKALTEEKSPSKLDKYKMIKRKK